MDVYTLIPKNKFDNAPIGALSQLTDDEIEPILPSLLEWLQDINWPVASELLPVLASHPSALAPLILKVLSPEAEDEIWKYWIVTCLLPLFPDEELSALLPALRRIAANPTPGERGEELDEAAALFLQERSVSCDSDRRDESR